MLNRMADVLASQTAARRSVFNSPETDLKPAESSPIELDIPQVLPSGKSIDSTINPFDGAPSEPTPPPSAAGAPRSSAPPKTSPDRQVSMGDTSAVIRTIGEAAKKHGVDPARLLALALHETGGRLDPGAVNKNSGAKGLFQALPAWSKQYGITGLEFNPEAISDAAARSLKATANTRNPYVSYLIHNQGRAGAEMILRAAMGEAPLPAKIRRNMLAQPGFKGKAADDATLAKAFIQTQRNSFMKHYKKAVQLVGERQAEERAIASSPSNQLDWDSMFENISAGTATAAAQQVASELGPSLPRKTFGGKLYAGPSANPTGGRPPG